MILDITKKVYNQLELLTEIDKYSIVILYKSSLERFLAERIKQEILYKYNLEIKLIEYNNIDCIYVCFVNTHVQLEMYDAYSRADMTMRWNYLDCYLFNINKCAIKINEEVLS